MNRESPLPEISAPSRPPKRTGWQQPPLDNHEALAAAWVGTALAGGLYPVAIAASDLIWRAVGSSIIPRSFGVSDNLALLIPAWAFGTIYAGGVGLFVVLAAAAMHGFIGLDFRSEWAASTVGGWTGFFCTAPILDPAWPFAAENVVLIALGVFMGQLGAGWARRYLLFADRGPSKWSRPTDRPPRLTLRQMFGITTAVCIAATIVALAKIEVHYVGAALAAAGLQAIVIGAVALVRRRRCT